MKKTILLSALAMGIVFSSCKKSTPTPTPSSNNNSGYVSTYGVLKCQRNYMVNTSNNTLLFAGYAAFADFSSNPNFSTVVPVTSVNLNGVFFQNQGNYYIDSTYNTTGYASAAWKVVGLNTIPSFTVTDNDSMPSYTGFLSLPDTIKRNQNLAVNLTGISYNSDVSVQISQGANMIDQPYLNPGNCTITVPTSTLTSFSAGMATLSINCNKYLNQTVSGKGFLFVKSNVVQKDVVIK